MTPEEPLYMVVFRLDDGPVQAVFESEASARARYDSMRQGWSDVFLCRVEDGPRDVLDEQRRLLASGAGSTVAARPGPAVVYVFGSFHNEGHHVRTVGGAHAAAVPYDVLRACDGLNPGGRRELQVEGRIVRDRVTPIPAGWSFVSWWDRKGDERHGSHTGILAEGTWTDAELIAAGKRLAPWAFRVAVDAPPASLSGVGRGNE